MPKSSPGQASLNSHKGKAAKPSATNHSAEVTLPEFSQSNRSSILNMLGLVKPGSVILAMALGFIGFCGVGTIITNEWTTEGLVLYVGLLIAAVSVFLLTNRRERSPAYNLVLVLLESGLLVGSVLVAGLNSSLIFSLLPLYVVVGHIQTVFQSRYALPLTALVWAVLILCVYGTENAGIQANFVIIVLMLSLPLIFTTMIARFIRREGEQHTRLVKALTELQSSEERYRQVTDRANDAIYILDEAGRFSFVNPRMAELSGYRQEELIGRHFSSLLSQESRHLTQERLRASAKSQPKYDLATPVTLLELLRQDGKKVTVEVNATTLPGKGEGPEPGTNRGWIGVARDVTEQQLMRAQTERRNRDLAALNAVISTATQSLELDKTLNNTVTTLVDVLGADVAGITLIEDETRLLKVGAYKGASDMVVRAVSPGNLKDGEGLTGEVALTGQPLLIGDMTSDSRVSLNTVNEMGLRAFAAAPIKSRDRIIGVLSLISHHKDAFTEDDLNLLVSIGHGLAVAIENARLYGTSLNQVRELTCLADIASAINLAQSLGQTLNKIAETIGGSLGYRGCAIYLLEAGQHLVQAYGTHGLSPKVVEFINNSVNARNEIQDFEQWTIFKALTSAVPVVSLITRPVAYLPDNVLLEEARLVGWNSVISVPLILQGQNVGIIGCFSPEKTPPPESELRLLTTIANQTAVAVQNARLYREQQRRGDQLRVVAELGRKIGSILSVSELLPFITRLLQQAFDYYAVSIFLTDPEQPGELVLKATSGWSEDTSPVGLRMRVGNRGVIPWVAEHGEPIVLPDVSEDPRYQEYTQAGIVRSELTVPIRSGTRVIGVIDIASTVPNGFDTVDLATMQAMAEQVSIALDNARLYTELNRMVVRLKTTNVDLEEATRHKSEFLANMSHELRTPLNAIIGFSEVLQDQVFGGLNDKQTRYVGNILTSGRHLLTLVNDVLDLAKVEAGRMELRPEEFDPDAAIRDVEAIVSSIASKKQLRISNKLEANLNLLRADKSKFKQILYNLLSNAVKFTPENGAITVFNRLAEHSVSGEKVPRRYLELAVNDTGIGISREDQEHIFEEFRQVDNSYSRQYQGTGLGLALSRRLIELHGGRIWVESEPGVGSTFSFILPLEMAEVNVSNRGLSPAEPIDRLLEAHVQTRLEKQVAQEAERIARPLEISPALSPRPPADANAPGVLVVEDDDKAAELLNLYLTEMGYQVARAYTGTEVLEVMGQMSQPPALVTMDIMLPHKNGWDVLRELKQHPLYKDIPVIIISLMDNPATSQRLGAAASLVKPIKRDEFLATFRRLTPDSRVGVGLD